LLILLPVAAFVALLLNYVGWITIGRFVTTRAEREQLSNEDRAKLAWSYWNLPARRPKA
jgi:hypothetical protein